MIACLARPHARSPPTRRSPRGPLINEAEDDLQPLIPAGQAGPAPALPVPAQGGPARPARRSVPLLLGVAPGDVIVLGVLGRGQERPYSPIGGEPETRPAGESHRRRVRVMAHLFQEFL